MVIASIDKVTYYTENFVICIQTMGRMHKLRDSLKYKGIPKGRRDSLRERPFPLNVNGYRGDDERL